MVLLFGDLATIKISPDTTRASWYYTCPCGRAKSFWFCDGIIVPVEEADEAEDADEESSS
jgi:hypothetical protein